MNYLQGVHFLLKEEPFYATLLTLMGKVYTDKVATCGISVDKNIKLYINEEFFSQFKAEEVGAILKHECLHVICDHIFRYKELEDGEYKNISNYNIAADLAINQLIHHLPKNGRIKTKDGNVDVTFITFESFQKQIPSLLEKQTVEYYYNELCKAAKEGKIPSQSQEGHGDHEKWGGGSSEMQKQVVKEAVKSAADSNAGNIPRELSELISTLFKKEVNWKKMFRSFVASAVTINKTLTRKKRNRRYGILSPGKKKDVLYKLALCVDTSGSMYQEQFNQILAEINSIYNDGNTVQILMADTQVQSVIDYKGQKELDFKGRGGTLYSPALKKAEELKADVIVYFGDMDNYDKENVYKPKAPVIWCSVNGQEPPATWGKRVQIHIN